MSVLEQLLKNKEELFVKFLQVIEGKETGVRVNLDGVKIKVGDATMALKGDVEFTFIPFREKGKSKPKG
jgi:hypothetical protein